MRILRLSPAMRLRNYGGVQALPRTLFFFILLPQLLGFLQAHLPVLTPKGRMNTAARLRLQ